MFDSRQYEFADLALVLGGVNITGFRAIQYTESMEKEALYAKGRYPRSIQRGNYSIEGTITLLQSEYQKLVEASPNKSILNISLNATIAYGANIEDGTPAGTITYDQILGIEFTEAPKELNQGDMFMELALPFIALRLFQD
ncbi:MAG: hypothetical protein LBD76_01855 [Prevotellaceae bacterium]|jgi:hypothetical protein|nr:hypothetical protein [Prevotellaceae bacterium]